MPNTETQQMMLTVIEHAQSAKPSEFRLLRNWSDYRYHVGKRRSFKLLVRALRSGSDRLFKSYCSSVRSSEEDLNKLLAYQQMLKVIDFYLHELDTIDRMIIEYEGRLWNIL